MSSRSKMKKAGDVSVVYEVTHHGPKTQLEFDLELSWSEHSDGLEFIVDWPSTTPAGGKTPREAIAKMSSWLYRASAALEDLSARMPDEPAPWGGDISLPVRVTARDQEIG